MAEFKSDNSVDRVLKNGVFAALGFAVFTLSRVFLIPFMLRHYGSGSYGLIALAGFLTQYVGMISGVVSGAVGRYINVALNKNDWKQANEIFSTTMIASIVLIVLQIPVYIVGIWKLDWLISFPPEVAADFRILVLCNILIFFISTLTGILFTPLVAANRLDIGDKFGALQQLLRFALLLSLVSVFGAKLWIVGVVDLGLAIVGVIYGYAVVMRRLAQQMRFSWNAINLKWAKPVLGMAGWSLISMLGYSMFLKTDIWMINRFVSNEMAGVYAALLLWPNLVKQVGGMVGGLLFPVFTIDFAKGNIERIKKTCLLSNQVLSYGAAYGCGIFVVGASGLIRFWLGEKYVQYATWAQLLVGQWVFTIGGSLVWRIFVAIGKTKYMAVGDLISGIVNIILSLLLVYYGFGAMGVLVGTLVALFLKDNVMFPFWISQETGIPYREFLFIYIRSGLVFGLVVGVGNLIRFHGSGFSFLELTVSALLSFCSAMLLIYLMTGKKNVDEIMLFVKSTFFKKRELS